MRVNDYVYGTTPYDHQDEGFSLSRDQECFALLMEQGTGKTKVIIDTASWLYLKGRISGMLIIAPNGVHRNWIENEIPKHMPDYILYDMCYWTANPNAAEKKQMGALASCGRPAIKILAMNVEALTTAKGYEMAKNFLMAFRTLMVIDESTVMKNHKAIRTEKILALGKHAPYRRVLTGTPVTQSPLDVYTQFAFLDEYIFKYTQSYYGFKARYCELLEDPGSMEGLPSHLVGQIYALRKIRQTPRGRTVQMEMKDAEGRKMYRNLDELQKIIAPYSFRVLKEDCLDLPPKIYQKRYVDLSPNQEKLYTQLRKDMMAEFNGRQMTTQLALTKMLRLQQIIGGFFCPDPEIMLDEDGELILPDKKRAPIVQVIDKKNPRVESFLDFVQESSGKVLGWARFRAEIEAIVGRINEEFGEGYAAPLYGGSGGNVSEFRQKAIHSYENETLPAVLIGNPQAKGVSRGQTMVRGSSVVYYSNSFSLEDRLQSEDRAHRIGQTGGDRNHVLYTDFEAPNTIDGKVIAALRSKKDVADMVTGDCVKDWI